MKAEERALKDAIATRDMLHPQTKSTVKTVEHQTESLRNNQCITNCQPCQKSCHDPCYLDKSASKAACACIVANKCKQCGCGPDVHWHTDVRHKYVEVTKTIDVDEVVRRYDLAYGQVFTYEQALGQKKHEIEACLSLPKSSLAT